MTREEVKRIYDRAFLNIEEEDLDRVCENFTQILDSIDVLEELDTEGVEMLENILDKDCEFREDEVKDSLRRSLALSNSDLTEYGYFKLDRVVE